ncbi:MAG: hypothetical protein M3008_07930 [Chloroflexota bacterium]|nr:hypothetical protein [Chloroflexota bacterium]
MNSSDLDTLLSESLAPARVSYDAAGLDWIVWLSAHPLPTNAVLDARLADPTTRAGFVAFCRTQGIYHLPTVEFVSALAGILKRLLEPWLEVGAGRGSLTRALRAAGVPITATDDGAWWPDPLPDDVERCAITDALQRYQPRTALCVWPPRETNWPALFRAVPSVHAYVLIGDGPRGMTGDAASWSGALGWRRRALPRLAALGRCRLDADGPLHTHALLVHRAV